MNRSMLNRLPDIVTLARQRARELWTYSSSARAGHRRPSWSVARFAAESGAGHRVSLLCGDDLSVMSGLLSGQAQDGPLAGRVSMVWLSDSPGPAADSQNTPIGSMQARVRRLIELSTRLFLARDLLVEQGALVVTADTDPDQCAERLLGAVFGQARALPTDDDRPRTERAYLAGATVPEELPRGSGPALLGAMVGTCTGRDDHVLVMGAQPAFATWVAALERRWVLAQAEPLTFSLLREHVIERQLRQAQRQLADESAREWGATRVTPARRKP